MNRSISWRWRACAAGPGANVLQAESLAPIFMIRFSSDQSSAISRAGCTCTVVNEGRIFDHANDPGVRNGPQDLSNGGNIHLIHKRGRPPNVKTRDNPHGSPSGGAACLKGEAAGWTLREWRQTKCCSGTTLKALSAQTAYSIYGVAPFSSNIVTNHVTIGVCLEN